MMNKNTLTIIGIITFVVLTFSMPKLISFYSLNSEVADFSYKNNLANLERYPDDKVLSKLMSLSMADKEIKGYEDKMIFDYVMSEYGSWSSGLTEETSEYSKHNLTVALNKLNQE